MSEASPPHDTPGSVTHLLKQASGGNRRAFDQLFPLVYDELKRLASHKLEFERDGHTLNTTALVHEAYMKLVDQSRVEWQSRAHFFAVASQAMRRILIDYAKMRKAGKRGAGARHVSLDDEGAQQLASQVFGDSEAVELLALNDALDGLAKFNPRGADVVQYRFFGGLTNPDIAEVLGVSEVTVRRDWTLAKTWLRRELGDRISGQSRVFKIDP